MMTFFCCEERRRNAVRDPGVALNGIDFLEVDDDPADPVSQRQRTLLVHFVKPIAAGSLIKDARISNSMLRREVVVEEDVEIDDCLIMDYTVIRRGSRLKGVIVDRYNVVEANSRIGFDTAADRARYTVSDGGVVVLAKGQDVPDVTRYQI